MVHTFFGYKSRSKGMTVDIWIRDYNPPRCFQKKVSGRKSGMGKPVTALSREFDPTLPKIRIHDWGVL
jgi:hypothetical protein